MVGPKGTDIRFKHDLDQVCARLLLPYKDCTVSLKEFLRPDAKLREVVTGRQLLWEVKEDEDHIKAGYLRIEQIVRINLANAEKVLELYKPFLFLLDEEERVSSFLEEPAKTREDFSAYVQHLQDTVAKLNEQCPNLLRMQMMRVDCLDVNKKLVQCSQECVAKLLRSLSTRNQDRNGRLVKQFEHLNARITRQPNNEDQLVELEVAIENAASTEMPKLVNEYNDIKEWLYLTWDLDHMLEDDDYKAIYAASEWKNYATKIADRDNDLKEDRMRIEGKLVERRTHFQDELTGLVNKVGKFKDKGSVRMLEDCLNEIKKQLAAAMAMAIDSPWSDKRS
ncbi:unnamed protein product [Polarella glacialis]|uniref:Uncharacterized protein n=1 Tax=Polarella glacialis TaxID=89957 RepID=A0A813JHJ8_POLGL|nr:unnamed protein product [Polarella glacialis]